MIKQLTERILRISGLAEDLQATLTGPQNSILTTHPFVLDRSALSKYLRPEEYGTALTLALNETIYTALQAVGSVRIRVVIEKNAPADLHTLRWECLLRSKNTPLLPLATGPHTLLSRLLHPDVTEHARAPQTAWPLRALVVMSNPRNLVDYQLSPVDVPLERAELERALRPLRGLVELTFLEPPISLDQLIEALETAPHILHFVGHGAFHQSTGQAALFLEDATTRKAAIVRQDTLLQRLKTVIPLPQLIVLTACESAAHVQTGSLVGLAPALIEAGTGAVVAMYDKVGMDTAREFNYHFYRRLATHGLIDLATNEARSYLLDRGGWSWSIPTLFLERGAERIFMTPPEALEAEPARPGELLILIPEFQGHEAAFFEIDLRDYLRERLREADLNNVRVVWLQQSAFSPGDEDNVRRLAARYGAVLVIWGWYDRSRFRAQFTVTAPLFSYREPHAPQGAPTIGSLFNEQNDFAIFVNQELPRHVEYFVFFTLSQLYYWEGAYEAAITALNRALATVTEEEPLPGGIAHAYFYRGNLYAVQRQDRPAAIADYRQALALQPDLTNAAFNLGDALRILGNTARAQGREDAACSHYQEAIAAYTQALDTDPEYSRAYERRGLAHYELRQYAAATADYRAALTRAPHAETYYQLGLVLRDQGAWQAALEQFDQAAFSAPGIGRYYFGRARLQAWLGQTDAARTNFQAYLRLTPREDERSIRVRQWLTAHADSDTESTP